MICMDACAMRRTLKVRPRNCQLPLQVDGICSYLSLPPLGATQGYYYRDKTEGIYKRSGGYTAIVAIPLSEAIEIDLLNILPYVEKSLYFR